MVAVTAYKQLAHYFPSINREQTEQIKPYWDKWQKNVGTDRTGYSRFHEFWSDIELHLVSQTWGSTACGWGGIGGAAITTAYTLVITNKHLNAAFIYWAGKLAYVVDMDKKYQTLITGESGYSALPGLNRVKERLTVIYSERR